MDPLSGAGLSARRIISLTLLLILLATPMMGLDPHYFLINRCAKRASNIEQKSAPKSKCEFQLLKQNGTKPELKMVERSKFLEQVDMSLHTRKISPIQVAVWM